MKTTTKRIQEIEVVTNILCDRCGLKVDQNGLSYTQIGDYDSKIGDGVEWSIDLCEVCCEWLFSQCLAHPINIKDRGINTYD